MTTTSVFYYRSFREFLIQYAANCKAEKHNWTYTKWAKALGLKSTAALTMVLNGKRMPGHSMAMAFTRYFNFNDKERRFFLDLVALEKVKGNLEFLEKLQHDIERQAYEFTERVLDDDVFKTIANWYYYPVREMTRLKEFSASPAWIASKLRMRVVPNEIRSALDSLVRLGLLKRDRAQKLAYTNENITTSDDIPVAAIRRFHEQMIEQGKKAIHTVDVQHREVTASTFPIRVSDLEKAKEFLRLTKKEFLQRFECNDADAVYQINIQFFPLTEV